MDYKIMIFSSPGCLYDESDFVDIKKYKEVDLIKISKLKNLGTLDITQLLKAIYNGFDGIFVIIKGKVESNKFLSEFDIFNKPIEEVNRILGRRGLGDQRLKLFKYDGTSKLKLNDAFNNFLTKLIHLGPNPINTGIRKMQVKTHHNYNFNNISVKKLLYASYKASYNVHYRALFKAKENILKLGKYNESELNYLLNSIFEAETARKYILEELKGYNPLTFEEILDLFEFTEDNVIRDIFYLKEQGYLEELVEELPLNRLIHKYKVKDIIDIFKENCFRSVAIIHDNNVCYNCGLCSSICPTSSIELSKDYLYIDEGLCVNCGLCYSVCPQSFSIKDLYKLMKKPDDNLKYSKELGFYRNIFSARTLKYGIRKVGQDGGIATSLLYYLLNKNLVDAVVTIIHSKNNWKPEVGIIEKELDLYKTAGTTYAHSPILLALEKTKKYKKIALVSLPCKLKALTKGELFPVKLPFLKNIKYKIGLFCKASFPYEKLLQLFSDKFSVDIYEIVKMDINQGKFVVTIESGEIFSVPLKECDFYGSDFCIYCNDFTAEFADISLGSIGSELGWSSVITRTEKGEEIFNGAIKQGLIEIKSYADESPIQLKIKKLAEIKQESSIPIELNII
ncbi:MAG: Coenzyme F420 hydrogenase/dehydrogenase, beta subunit C-terminal domain [Candidatus Hermodarchaeota archaeon]